MKKKLLAGLATGLFLFGIAGISNATSLIEIGDAGQLLNTAQIAYGADVLNSISGQLTGSDDIDMYGIYITDPSAFSVTVTSSLSEDNDGMLWLFDADGFLAISDDDGGSGYIPQFNAGELSGYSAGNYFLAYDLYDTTPIGSPLTGWYSAPNPDQYGSYSLVLTGASGTNAPVPEPATMLLFGTGLAGLVGARVRRKKK